MFDLLNRAYLSLKHKNGQHQTKEFYFMTQSSKSIQVATQRYIYDNETVSLDTIPEGSEYLCVNLDASEAVLYTEVRVNRAIEKLIFDTTQVAPEERLSIAKNIWMHVTDVVDKEKDVSLAKDVQVLGVITNEQINVDLPMADNEIFIPMLRFRLKKDLEGARLLSDKVDYLIEIHETEPFPMLSRRILLDENRQLLSTEYLQYSINSENMLFPRSYFSEITDLGATELWGTRSGYEWRLMDRYGCMPDCDESYLEDIAPFILSDYVKIETFDGESIDPENLANHEDYTRVWFDDEGDVKVVESVLKRGIVKTEIFNVPEDKQRNVLHGYLRLIHQRKDILGIDQDEQRIYVEVYQPLSHESSSVVSLNDGESKMHSTIFHIEGSKVLHQCIVLDEKGLPTSRYTFSDFNEVNLMKKMNYQYSEDGQVHLVDVS